MNIFINFTFFSLEFGIHSWYFLTLKSIAIWIKWFTKKIVLLSLVYCPPQGLIFNINNKKNNNNKKIAIVGIEPTTLRLLVPRSNQTELCGYLFIYKINTLYLEIFFSKKITLKTYILFIFYIIYLFLFLFFYFYFFILFNN